MKVKKVAEGAYFVPSYSDQTIVGVQNSFTTQAVNIRIDPDEARAIEAEDQEKESEK